MNVESYASSENPRKRVKLEEPDEKPFQNHPTLYIPDGSVILRTGGTLFCVHKSLLSKHSPVFKELFQQDNERFRGLPYYTMEETREDLEVLLNVLYDGLYVDVQNLTVETFPTLAAVLRMASKYKIERPCHEIVARIRKQWPASLADHDTLVAQVRAPVQQLLAADDKGKAREGGAANVNAPPQTAFSNSVYLPQRSYHMNQMGSAANASAGPAMQNPFAMHGNAMHQIPVDPVPHFQPGGHLLAAHLDPFARNLNGSTVAQRVHDQFAQERAGAAIAAFLNRRQNAGPSNANPAAPAAGPAPGPTAPAVAAPVEDLIIHPASVIAVLRECGYSDSELFFPLFYALSRTTAQFGGAGLGYHLAPLSAADMERFVVGIERLRARHTALVVSTPSFDPVQGFGGSFHFCREGAQELWANLVHTLLVTNEQRPHEPVEEWQDMVASVNAQHGRHQVCADCCKVIVAKIQAYRAALWESLPRFFELA